MLASSVVLVAGLVASEECFGAAGGTTALATSFFGELFGTNAETSGFKLSPLTTTLFGSNATGATATINEINKLKLFKVLKIF